MACPYADRARLHDSIVKHAIEAFKASYEKGLRFDFGIENLDGELKYRPFMHHEHWPTNPPYNYAPFDCCAFRHPAKKPMSFWTSMESYTPEGTTGNGRCNGGECGMCTVNPDTGRVNHNVKIARDPKDGFTGAGAMRMKNAMPSIWMDEFLTAVEESSNRRVVIDLCAGWQSLRPVCEKPGLEYVAVDKHQGVSAPTSIQSRWVDQEQRNQ